jgi:hypothetical protein
MVSQKYLIFFLWKAGLTLVYEMCALDFAITENFERWAKHLLYVNIVPWNSKEHYYVHQT